jgi:hypothetical protein
MIQRCSAAPNHLPPILMTTLAIPEPSNAASQRFAGIADPFGRSGLQGLADYGRNLFSYQNIDRVGPMDIECREGFPLVSRVSGPRNKHLTPVLGIPVFS